MEKDTVLLDIHAYNELRDFEQKIKNGRVYALYTSDYHTAVRFIGIDKAFLKMNEKVLGLESSNSHLKDKIKLIKRKKQESDEDLLIKGIKEMSYWELFKLRFFV